MNAADILKYGHLTLMTEIEYLPESAVNIQTVCGIWSTQAVMAHLTSYETMLVEILSGLISPCPTPTLDRYLGTNPQFNDEQVALRQHLTCQAVVAEYQASQQAAMIALGQIPAETLRLPGVLAWYGAEYGVDDFLVYTDYGHKREHSAQSPYFVMDWRSH